LALVARVEAARKTVPAVFPVFNLDPAVGRQRAIKRAKTATPAEKAVAILADVPNHPLNRLAAEVAHWLWSEDKSNPKPPAATLAAQYVRHWLSDEPWNRHDVRGSRLTVDAAVANAFRLVAEQEAMEPGWFVRRAETFAWLDKHYTENVNGYLFTNSKGKPYLSDNVVKYGVHRAMVKLGIQTAKGVHVGIHCFRHGVTSELLESGTPIHVVTRLMRHADSHVTLEHYAHIVGDAERVASEKFSQRIGQNITQLESDSELESTSSVKTA